MKHYYLKFFSKLKYENHLIPIFKIEKYIWGISIEFRFLKYRIEIRRINKIIASELIRENGE